MSKKSVALFRLKNRANSMARSALIRNHQGKFYEYRHKYISEGRTLLQSQKKAGFDLATEFRPEFDALFTKFVNELNIKDFED